MDIAYLVHDLADAAVRRRVRMLQSGGASLVVAGFRRTAEQVDKVEGVPSIDLGPTVGGRLVARVCSVLWRLATVRRWAGRLKAPKAVVARNLEMLVLAAAARRFLPGPPRLIYECLDIHRTMVGGPLAGLLRRLERALLRRTDLVIVSSPAFVSQYFQPLQHLVAPTLLVENKVVPLAPRPGAPGPRKAPWRIGWFGVIRCQRSLDILCALAAALNGRIEVVIRGKPYEPAFRDFQAQIDTSPHVAFLGPYRPEDLPAIYAEADFAWCMDWYEAGQNSTWLLPNRIYEGAYNNVPPLVFAHCETGAWARRHELGWTVEKPLEDLTEAFSVLTPKTYDALARAAARTPAALTAAGPDDCRALVAAVLGAAP